MPTNANEQHVYYHYLKIKILILLCLSNYFNLINIA